MRFMLVSLTVMPVSTKVMAVSTRAGSQSVDTTVGPLAFDGRTITLVARTRAMHVGDDGRGALHVRSRPRHVEVLDVDGRRKVVAVHDVERMLVLAITFAGLAAAFAIRTVRTRKQE
jgi:hypothetical protein